MVGAFFGRMGLLSGPAGHSCQHCWPSRLQFPAPHARSDSGRLMIEVQVDAMRASSGVLDLYMSKNGEWQVVQQISKRAKHTVILKQGTLDDILADVGRFVGKERWYRERDIPHRRGYLLYGPPGCGKSSLIRAVASSYNLPLAQLSLKHSRVGDGGIEALLHAAPEGAILFLEDVDAVAGVPATLKRTNLV